MVYRTFVVLARMTSYILGGDGEYIYISFVGIRVALASLVI
jgi:hypothetical protein